MDRVDVLTELDRNSAAIFKQADLVIAAWHDQSYVVKSRWDTEGVTQTVPHRPDTVIAYRGGSSREDRIPQSSVLRKSGE